MKNISKLFAAFATVALCTSCGSEDILDNTQGSVPAGMHEVSLTINTHNSRVAIDDQSGDLTWEAGDVIKVKYTDDNYYDFRIEGTGGSSTTTFKGIIPEAVFNDYAPQYVYYYGNPKSQDLSVQNNFVVNTQGKYSFKGYNVTLSSVNISSQPADKCVEEFSAMLAMKDACMLRVAKENFTVKSEEDDGKTNYYVEVTLSYDPGYGDNVSESYKVNNIKVDAEGKPAEDLTFFVTNQTLSSGAYHVKAFINGDNTNPYHTSYEGYEPAVVKLIQASQRFVLTPYTWMIIHCDVEALRALIKCDDNSMTWEQYKATNSNVKIANGNVGYDFSGTTYQLYYDTFFMNPVKSSDKVSKSDGLTIGAYSTWSDD